MTIEILMPALSPTMEEGTLSKWLVNEGDSISSGDLIAEIETDKATMEVEAVDEGEITHILNSSPNQQTPTTSQSSPSNPFHPNSPTSPHPYTNLQNPQKSSPPSEKLSGVRFNIPITFGNFEKFSFAKFFFFEVIFFKSHLICFI